MKKLLIILSLLITTYAHTAKISEYDANSAVTTDDLFVTVDDPSGTPVTKKTTAAAIASFVNTSKEKYMVFTIPSPSILYSFDTQLCLIPALTNAITVTKIEVTLDAATNQVAGDLKWADAFIGFANAAVINDFDTTAGVRVDTTIYGASVAAGKCLYIDFDSQPNAAITQMTVKITYTVTE